MEKIKNEKYKIILKYTLFLVMFIILASAEINFSIKPFLVPFLFSLVWCNQNPYICSGLFAFSFLLFLPINLNNIISCFSVVFVLLFFYMLHKKIKKPINRHIYVLYSFLAQIPLLYYSFTTPENLINSVVSVFVGLVLLVCFNIFFSSVFVKGFSSVFTINEIISGCVFLISFSVGLSSINIINFELIKIFGVFLLLLSVFCIGTKSGFIVANCLGLGYALYSYNLTYLATFSLFCAIILCFKSNNKYFSSLEVCLIDIFLGLYLKVYPQYNLYSFFSVVLGALFFLSLPKQILQNIKLIFGDYNSSILYRNFINSTKNELNRRLNNLSEVFCDMEINFKNMIKGNLPKEEAKQLLINEVCSKVCSDCKEKHKCLRILNEETLKAFNDMIEKGFAKGKVTLLDIPTFLSSRCNRSASIISGMNGLINSYKQYTFMINSQDTSKILIGEQMGGVSKLLKNLINENINNLSFDFEKENMIKEELKFNHIYCSDAITFTVEDSYNISLIIKKGDYNKNEITKILSKIYKTEMKISSCSEVNSNFEILTLTNAPKFDCIFGVSGIAKQGSEISGDTYSFIKINDEKILIAISDGMGSGEGAQKLSELTLNLIENFYRAGFDNEIILNSVNKLLTINSEDNFSALDICVLDFKQETIDFIKLGAPISFIKTDETTEIIESGSLPIGILEEISPVITKKIISGREIILLVSDGVIEAIGGEDKVANIVNSFSSLNPQEICDNIISLCRKRSQNSEDDDCTCVALRIYEIK